MLPPIRTGSAAVGSVMAAGVAQPVINALSITSAKISVTTFFIILPLFLTVIALQLLRQRFTHNNQYWYRTTLAVPVYPIFHTVRLPEHCCSRKLHIVSVWGQKYPRHHLDCPYVNSVLSLRLY